MAWWLILDFCRPDCAQIARITAHVNAPIIPTLRKLCRMRDVELRNPLIAVQILVRPQHTLRPALCFGSHGEKKVIGHIAGL